MTKRFLEFLALKESTEGNIGTKKASSEIKLADDTDFKPFVIDGENHPNLRVIVKAFLDSDKVALPGPDGYPQKLTTLDPNKGLSTPKIKKKTLYLVGGAVRDHLLGKTPKNYDLVTDAAPDEIRLVLRSAGFTETKPQDNKNKKYDRHPESGDKSKVFFAKGWDRGGKEYTFGARVNGEDFEISTFRKDSKGGANAPENAEFGGLDDDSQRRDFTVNSMYIPLTSADGANARLVDPHGGAHHLRSGEVKFVGNPKDRLEEDEGRALRYIRQIASHGKNTNIGDDVKKAFENIKDMPSVSRERIKDEFLKGLQHPDVDATHYIKLIKDLGLLGTIFPDMDIKLDGPDDFSDKKEKRLAIAWLLRGNKPEKIEKTLHQGSWGEDEIRDILALVELSKWLGDHDKNPAIFLDKFFDMKKKLHKTGMVPSLVKQWGKMNKHPDNILGKFLNHELDTKGYVSDDSGKKSINPKILELLGGKAPHGSEFSDAIKKLETDKFSKELGKKNEDEEPENFNYEDHEDQDSEE